MYQFTDDLIALGRRAVDLTTKLSLGEQTSQRLIAMCLLARTIDLSSAAAALLRSHEVSGIPHLVRGQLEALVDLRNLLSDPAYVEEMDATYCDQVQRVLKAVVREDLGGPHLPDMSAALATARTRLDQLRARGISAPNVSDRFRQAALTGEYYSVYAYLCSHTHNGVAVLESMHVDKTREPYALRIGHDQIDTELAIAIELSIRIPVDCVGITMQHFDGITAEEYEQLKADLDALRQRWAPLVGLEVSPFAGAFTSATEE